jgi:hypothetical protein
MIALVLVIIGLSCLVIGLTTSIDPIWGVGIALICIGLASIIYKKISTYTASRIKSIMLGSGYDCKQFKKIENKLNEYTCIAYEYEEASQKYTSHRFRVKLANSEENEIVMKLSSDKHGANHWLNFDIDNYCAIVTTMYPPITTSMTLDEERLHIYIQYEGIKLWVNYLLKHVPLHRLCFDVNNIGVNVYARRFTLFDYDVINNHIHKTLDDLRTIFSQQLVSSYNAYKDKISFKNDRCFRYINHALLYPNVPYRNPNVTVSIHQ